MLRLLPPALGAHLPVTAPCQSPLLVSGRSRARAPCSLWITLESHGNSQFIPGSQVPRVSGAQFAGQGAQHHHRPTAVLGTDQKPSQELSEQMQEKGNASWNSLPGLGSHLCPSCSPLSYPSVFYPCPVPVCFIPVLQLCPAWSGLAGSEFSPHLRSAFRQQIQTWC